MSEHIDWETEVTPTPRQDAEAVAALARALYPVMLHNVGDDTELKANLVAAALQSDPAAARAVAAALLTEPKGPDRSAACEDDPLCFRWRGHDGEHAHGDPTP